MKDKEMDFIQDKLMKNTKYFYLHNDDTITKYVNGEFIREKSCGRKDWSHDWIENVKQEDIDTRYYNLDYTRKDGSNKK